MDATESVTRFVFEYWITVVCLFLLVFVVVTELSTTPRRDDKIEAKAVVVDILPLLVLAVLVFGRVWLFAVQPVRMPTVLLFVIWASYGWGVLSRIKRKQSLDRTGTGIGNP